MYDVLRRQGVQAEVSTLLEILLVARRGDSSPQGGAMFQPFLRFYQLIEKYAWLRQWRVSTLLEILPLVLGGFLGF